MVWRCVMKWPDAVFERVSRRTAHGAYVERIASLSATKACSKSSSAGCSHLAFVRALHFTAQHRPRGWRMCGGRSGQGAAPPRMCGVKHRFETSCVSPKKKAPKGLFTEKGSKKRFRASEPIRSVRRLLQCLFHGFQRVVGGGLGLGGVGCCRRRCIRC